MPLTSTRRRLRGGRRFPFPCLMLACECGTGTTPRVQHANAQEEQAFLASGFRPPECRSVEMKETGHSVRNTINKFASQIKKPPHRRSSPPLNWFPRKSTDSFLKRKLRLLQEGGGMKLSLVETLGNANPHYTRIAREKIAAQEAASTAMEARKAAMVEASWCRILQAARIQSKDAESNLERAEQCALRAFEEAKLMGVMMFDRPDCPRGPCEVQSSSLAIGGKSAHTINASFETEFEVDREVAAAIKQALIVLARFSSSSNKEEFKDLLRKIRQNPDDYETAQDSLPVTLQCEDDQSGVEPELHATFIGTELNAKHNSSNSSDDLTNKMVGRLKELQEDELSSLATIVATCGLNAALLEIRNHEDHDAQGVPQRRSDVNQFVCASKKKSECITNVPSLDKFLVKHVSRLEREVQEAQISKKNEDFDRQISDKGHAQMEQITTTSKSTSDLGSILIKHVSKFEREIQEAKKSQKQKSKDDYAVISALVTSSSEKHSLNHELVAGGPDNNEEYLQKMKLTRSSEDVEECKDFKLHMLTSADEKEEKKHSLDSNAFMLKPLNYLAQELEQVTNGNSSKSNVNKEMLAGDVRTKLENIEAFSRNVHGSTTDFDNTSLDKILIKPVHWLDREKMQALEKGSAPLMKKMDLQLEKVAPLGEILVKHQSKLEKAKLAAVQERPDFVMQKRDQHVEKIKSLGEILVKQQSKLGRVELNATQNSDMYVKHIDTRREARERELQDAWGGLSLGNSLKPHISKLEKVKADWRRAEEEEKTRERNF